MNKKIGIVGIEYALPSHFVDQKELAVELKTEEGKLTKGLGLREMGVVNDRSDVVSLALTAVSNLLKKYKINKNDVGRLEVGTESNFDGSKSIKTYLLQLFEGNTSICGVDSVNACYGGTNALLNAFCWMESSLWDERYAIVVCSDISVYKEEAAIPTSGAGAVAILLGINPVFVLNTNYLSHYFINENSFCKPKDLFPFPKLDGKRSIEYYLQAFKNCYEQIFKKNNDFDFDYICMHSPYPRLTEKTIDLNKIPIEKLQDSLLIARRNGNSYTSSLYFCLISLLNNLKDNIKIGNKILMFSFGSGCTSTMFVLEKVKNEILIDDVEERLNLRVKMNAIDYLESIKKVGNMKDFYPENEKLKDGYYLDKIENYARFYDKN